MKLNVFRIVNSLVSRFFVDLGTVLSQAKEKGKDGARIVAVLSLL